MEVGIVGAGTTRFGRHPDGDLRSLAEAATRTALDDARLDPADVGMVVFGNAVDGVLHGQEMVRGEVALRHAGFRGVPVLNVENACASSSSAFHVACLAALLGADQGTHAPLDRSPLMDRYADKARRYMERAGASVEDFARVAEKNRWHGSFNPHAQFRTPVTVDDVLASRMVADPLQLLMC